MRLVCGEADHHSLGSRARAASCPALKLSEMLLLLLSLAFAAEFRNLSSLALERRTLSPKRLEALSQVLNGPAWNSFLIIHLDAALSPWERQALLDVRGVRCAPHFTLTLGAPHHWSPDLHALEASTLHLVLFLHSRPHLLHSLWQVWKPRNLLLFSLQLTGGADILRDDSLRLVERLALITGLEQREVIDPEALGVYTVFPLWSAKPVLLDQWHPHIFAEWKTLFPDRFPNLHGHKLTVEAWPYEWPFFHLQDPKKVASGISLNMIQHLSRALNFTFNITWEENNTKIVFSKTNGSWDFLVYHGHVNFSCISVFPDEYIFADFDITKYYWSEGYSTFLVRPKPVFGWMAPLLPFRTEVWIALAIAAAAAVGLVTLQGVVSGQRRPSVVATWLCVQRGLLGHSVPIPSRSMLFKVFITCWYSFCFVLISAYTTNLVAILTKPAQTPLPRTFQQLAASSYRLALEDYGSGLPRRLKNSGDTVYQRLSQKFDLFVTFPATVKAMVAQTHALVDTTTFSSSVLKYKHGVHNATRIEQEMFPSSVVWLFPKYVPWKRKFDHVIDSMVEGGLIKHWYMEEIMKFKKWTNLNRNKELLKEDVEDEEDRKEEEKDDGRRAALSFHHLQTLFIIIAVSWVVGGAVLGLEIVLHRHRRQEPLVTTRPPFGRDIA